MRQRFMGSIGDAVHFGWATMKSNWIFFVVATLAVGIIQSLISGIGEKVPNLALIISLIGFATSMFFKMGFTRIFLNAVGSEKEPEVADFFAVIPLFFNYLIASVLYALMVLIGTVLLIIPGVHLAVKYSLYGYFIVDEQLSPMDALRASADVTDGIRWDLLGFMFVLWCINVLGLLAVGLGMLATLPATGIAFAYAYKNIVASPEETIIIPEPITDPEGTPPAPGYDETPPTPEPSETAATSEYAETATLLSVEATPPGSVEATTSESDETKPTTPAGPILNARKDS